jgi:hypothetical protein
MIIFYNLSACEDAIALPRNETFPKDDDCDTIGWWRVITNGPPHLLAGGVLQIREFGIANFV